MGDWPRWRLPTRQRPIAHRTERIQRSGSPLNVTCRRTAGREATGTHPVSCLDTLADPAAPPTGRFMDQGAHTSPNAAGLSVPCATIEVGHRHSVGPACDERNAKWHRRNLTTRSTRNTRNTPSTRNTPTCRRDRRDLLALPSRDLSAESARTSPVVASSPRSSRVGSHSAREGRGASHSQ